MVESQTPVAEILETLPSRDEIRRRIAENLRERQTLRQVLKLAEQRGQRQPVAEGGRR